MVFNGVIGESGGSHSLTVAGSSNDLVVLNNVNTWSGGTILAAGPTSGIVSGGMNVLQLGNAGALGSGMLTLDSGILSANVALTLTTPILLPNTAASISTITQGVNLTFAGSTTLIGNAILNLGEPNDNNANATYGGGLTTFTGGINGSGALTVTGNGILQLPTANTFTGGFTLNNMANSYFPSGSVPQGNILTAVVGNSGAFGIGPLTLSDATLTSTGPLTITNELLLNSSSQGLNLGTATAGIFTGANVAVSATITGESPITFTGPVVLLANTTLIANNTGGTIISGALGESSGSRSLAVAGTGTLTLSGANYYSGGTTLSPLSGPGVGVSFFDLSASPADGTVGNNNGPQTEINFNTTPSYERLDPNVNYPTNGGGLVGPATAGNPAALPGNITLTQLAALWSGYLNVVNGGTYTFTDLSDDGSTLYIDGNPIVINSLNTTNTGTTFLAPGLHLFQVQYYQGGGGAGSVISYSGPDTNNSTVVVPAWGTGTGVNSTNAGLVSFTPTAVTLNVANSSALGTGTLALNGGVFQAATALTINNAVTIGSTPFSPVAFAGSAITFTNTATLTNLANNTAVSVNNTTTFAGVISGSGSLTMSSTPVVAGTTTWTGGGNLVLSNADTYSGATTINTGTLTFNGGGTLSSTQLVTLNTGGTLTLDDTGTNLANRVNTGATVAFNGGTLNFLGNNTAASTQLFGSIGFNSGNSTIQSTAGTGAGSSVTLTATTVLGRSAGATANLVAGNGQILGSATNKIILNVPAPALLNNGIIKGFTVTDGSTGGFNLVTASGSPVSLSALPLASYTALSATGGNTVTQNILIDPTQTGFGAPTGAITSDTVNAILIRGDGITVSGAAGAVLTVGGTSGTAGMVVTSGGTTTGDTISVPTLAAGQSGRHLHHQQRHDKRQQQHHRLRWRDLLRRRQPGAVRDQYVHEHQRRSIALHQRATSGGFTLSFSEARLRP